MLDLNWSRRATPSPALELVERSPATGNGLPGLLFIHGAYAGAWCWEEHFLDYFAAQGFHCQAISLRGHGASAGRGSLHRAGLDDYVQDVATVVQKSSTPPVLIGHSMGGMVVQKYLETATVPAAVLMASVPHIGLGHSVARLLFRDPWLLGQMGLMQAGLDRWMDLEAASRAVFSPDLPSDLRARYAARMQPESRRALAEMSFANLPNRHRMASLPPMLVLAAADDALFETRTLEQTARYYNADFVILADLAHAMMLEQRWVRAADALNDWLRRTVSRPG